MISPLFVGLLLAAGVFFIYWSFWPQEARRQQARQGGFMVELRDHLTQAGYSSVTPANLVAGSVVLFLIAFVMVLALTRVVPDRAVLQPDGRRRPALARADAGTQSSKQAP